MIHGPHHDRRVTPSDPLPLWSSLVVDPEDPEHTLLRTNLGKQTDCPSNDPGFPSIRERVPMCLLLGSRSRSFSYCRLKVRIDQTIGFW